MKKSKIKDENAFIEDMKVMPAKELADKYGISMSAVYSHREKSGLTVYSRSHNVPTDFVEFAQNHNRFQATKYYHASYDIIKKWESLIGCRCSKRRQTRQVERDRVIKELSKTNTYAHIGRMYNISRQRVEQIVNRDKKNNV